MTTFYILIRKVNLENDILPYQKQLHLTLAYNFNPEHKKTLEDYAKKYINFDSPADWDMRLYSRDIRADSKFVNKSPLLKTFVRLAHFEFNLCSFADIQSDSNVQIESVW